MKITKLLAKVRVTALEMLTNFKGVSMDCINMFPNHTSIKMLCGWLNYSFCQLAFSYFSSRLWLKLGWVSGLRVKCMLHVMLLKHFYLVDLTYLSPFICFLAMDYDCAIDDSIINITCNYYSLIYNDIDKLLLDGITL